MVKVLWRDSAFTAPPAAYELDEVAKLNVKDMMTVGLLLHSDDNKVIIALTQITEPDVGYIPDYRHIMVIPREAVTKLEILHMES